MICRNASLVLHVDGNEGRRHAVEHILRSSGFEVAQAATGEEGLRLIHKLSPDLVILDVRLTCVDGTDVCRKIKEDPAMAHIPVLQLSAQFIESAVVIEELENGADAYLSSGVEPRELVATVKALLRLRAAEEQARNAALEWQATFESVRDAVLILDARGCLIRCNRVASQLIGGEENCPPNGIPISQLLPGLNEYLLCSDGNGNASVRKAPHEFQHGGRWFRATVDMLTYPGLAEPRQVCVVTDITAEKMAEAEIRRINDDLIRARDSALEASRAKSAFLANMSHELRTPLNIIIGYTEMLWEDALEQDLHAYVKDLEQIRETSRHLVELVSNVLDLSKIEAGRVDLQIHSVDIASMIEEIAETVKPLVEERENVLRLDLEYGLGSMWTDSVKLRQILLNLLSNACKFTGCGTITISASRRVRNLRDWVVFRISDTGQGIEPENLPKLFREYSQLGAGGSGIKGTGLGLAISQRLCAMIGGKIQVESTVGKGTVFTVDVPARVEDSDLRAAEVN